jgi:hypothetical protein
MKLTGLTNMFGTITAILTAISGLLVSMGCAAGATDLTATCAIPWLPPSATAIVAMVFGIITFILKLARPGGVLHSLFGGTAVVVANPTPEQAVGTVTPAQVASKT